MILFKLALSQSQISSRLHLRLLRLSLGPAGATLLNFRPVVFPSQQLPRGVAVGLGLMSWALFGSTASSASAASSPIYPPNALPPPAASESHPNANPNLHCPCLCANATTQLQLSEGGGISAEGYC